MKHTYKLLLVLVAITFIVACKKSGSSPSSPIVGKWTIVSDTIRLYQGGSLSDVSPDSLIGTNFIQFNSNGTGSETESDISSTFKWSISGRHAHGYKRCTNHRGDSSSLYNNYCRYQNIKYKYAILFYK